MKKKSIKYFFGVYRDYDEKIKVAQLCLSVDNLSCEILAEPGCITFMADRRVDAITSAKINAINNNCSILEINFEKYRIINLSHDHKERETG